MTRLILWLAAHTLPKYENDRRYRRYCVGLGFRFLGYDWGKPEA